MIFRIWCAVATMARLGPAWDYSQTSSIHREDASPHASTLSIETCLELICSHSGDDTEIDKMLPIRHLVAARYLGTTALLDMLQHAIDESNIDCARQLLWVVGYIKDSKSATWIVHHFEEMSCLGLLESWSSGWFVGGYEWFSTARVEWDEHEREWSHVLAPIALNTQAASVRRAILWMGSKWIYTPEWDEMLAVLARDSNADSTSALIAESCLVERGYGSNGRIEALSARVAKVSPQEFYAISGSFSLNCFVLPLSSMLPLRDSPVERRQICDSLARILCDPAIRLDASCNRDIQRYVGENMKLINDHRLDNMMYVVEMQDAAELRRLSSLGNVPIDYDFLIPVMISSPSSEIRSVLIRLLRPTLEQKAMANVRAAAQVLLSARRDWDPSETEYLRLLAGHCHDSWEEWINCDVLVIGALPGGTQGVR